MAHQTIKSQGFTPDDLENVATTMSAFSAIVGVLAAWVKSVFNGKKEPKNNKVDDKEKHFLDLSNHHFFVKSQHLKSQVTIFEGIDNEGREALFQMVIIHHVEIFEKYAHMLYNDYKKGLIPTKDYLRNKVHDMYEDFSIDFYNFHKSLHFLDDEEYKAIDIVLRHYKRWNSQRMMTFLSRVDEICSADYYPSVGVSVVAILDTSYIMLCDMLCDAQKSAQHINGHLDGLTFKGVKL